MAKNCSMRLVREMLERSIDDEAEREGHALHKAFRNKGARTMRQAIFSTHKGHGARAIAPPSGSRMHSRAS